MQDAIPETTLLPPNHISNSLNPKMLQCFLRVGFSSSVVQSFFRRLLVHFYAGARLALSQLTLFRENFT
jgi:hypothetical protein